MRRLNPVLALTIVLLSAMQLVAQDWPQFGGINRDGKSSETGLMASWPAGGPQLAWKANGVGIGYSSLIVVGDRIYTIGDVGDGQFMFALARTNGEQIWKRRIGKSNPTSYPGSRCTPTYSDGMLYALSTAGELFCVSSNEGDVLWQKNLKTEFDAQLMLAMGKYEWQFSESPLVDGDLVVVTPGSKTAVMAALNKTTGDTVWQTALPQSLGEQGADGAGYSSIVVADIQGKRQFVQLYGRGVLGVDAENGKYLWGYNRVANNVANISSAVISDNLVFVSTGYQTGSALLAINHENGRWSAEETYFLSSREFQNHHGGFVLHEGHIYGGHGHKQGLPVCINLENGQLAWGPQRNRGKGSASVAFADGHIYMRYEDGLVVLVQATPESYQEKGSLMIPDVNAKSWSRPVIAGGMMYLKEQDTIYCYKIATS